MVKLPGAAFLSFLLVFGGGFGAAWAQSVDAAAAAPVGRCGGLLCDAYYAMHPNAVPGATSLPCRDFLCAAFGGRTPEQQPLEQAAVAPAPAVPATKIRKKAATSKPAKLAAKAPEAAAQ